MAKPPVTNRHVRRIDFIDGMRCVAIMLVIVFHYFSRWTQPNSDINLYPYGSLFSALPIAKYGWCGVQLFFMISGFVIAMTLEKCGTISEFAARRYSRLAPAMFIFSAITALTVWIVPNAPFSVNAIDFIPSLTFLDPELLHKFPGLESVSVIDGSYWSLFVEAKFYLIASVLYFPARRYFVAAITMLSICVTILSAVKFGLLTKLSLLFGIPAYMPWFLIGIGSYLWHKGSPLQFWLTPVLVGIVELVALATLHNDPPGVIVAMVLPVLFLTVFVSATIKKILSLKAITVIGVSSYGLYLLHQIVGVTLIHALPTIFSQLPYLGIAAALCIMATLILAAHVSFRYIETPLSRRCLELLRGSSRTVPVPVN